jgi:hypothetical protein
MNVGDALYARNAVAWAPTADPYDIIPVWAIPLG